MRVVALASMVVLAGCGKGIEGPWEGICTAAIGDIAILTGDLGEVGVAQGFTGEHTLYRATEILVELPAGDTPDVTVSMVVCTDKDGCQSETDNFDKNVAVLTILDVNELPLIVGTGPVKGKKSITGTCETNFGPGDFTLDRTNKGPE